MFCRTGNDPQITRNSRPFFVKTSNPWPILRNHHHQQVSIGAISCKHGALPAHLAPVAPSAGLAELVQVHRLLVAQLPLKRISIICPAVSGGQRSRQDWFLPPHEWWLGCLASPASNWSKDKDNSLGKGRWMRLEVDKVMVWKIHKLLHLLLWADNILSPLHLAASHSPEEFLPILVPRTEELNHQQQ